jgi:hypothetical protein
MLLSLQRAIASGVLSGNDSFSEWDPLLVSQIAITEISERDRLEIYQNNTLSLTTDVLAGAYPVVKRLVGDEFFGYAARDFIRRNPPSVAILSRYGDKFPEFLASFEPAAELSYLSDVAHLEWAIHDSFFAADAAPLDPAPIGRFSAKQQTKIKFICHPAMRLSKSEHPIHQIWRANQTGNTVVPTVDVFSGPEFVLITRIEGAVTATIVSPDEYMLVDCIKNGYALSEALAATVAVYPDVNVQTVLVRQFQLGTFFDFEIID